MIRMLTITNSDPTRIIAGVITRSVGCRSASHKRLQGSRTPQAVATIAGDSFHMSAYQIQAPGWGGPSG